MPLEEDGVPPVLPSNAITALPTPLQPRRKRVLRTALHPRKRRRSAVNENASVTTATNDDDGADEAAFSALSEMSDTHIAILTLRSQWPGEAQNQLPRTPPIILRSQVHALVANTAAIDREIASLIVKGIIRPVHIPSTKPEVRREAYVMTQDFRLKAANDGTVFTKFFTTVFALCQHPLVDSTLISEVYGDEADNAINKLVRAGYLTLSDENTYSFAVPGMGAFVKNRTEGEKQIVRLLNTAPYREMLLPNLEMRTLKRTIFTAQWHVRDVVGSGIANTVSTSIGTLVRLPHSN